MYNSVDNYWKTSELLWKYYRDKTFLDANSAIADFPATSNLWANIELSKAQLCKIRQSR